jgi:NADPH:quinone reductase-like Zn-dependent oxidoreductase
MRADGNQLEKITSLLESEVIRPIVDRVFPLHLASDALAYVETGRSKGKVIIKVR